MKPAWPFLLVAASLFLSSAQGGLLLDDTFSSGTNPGYTNSTGGATITIEDGTPFGLTGNAILLSTSSNNRTMERTLNQSVTLSGIDDYVEVSLDYRFGALLDDNFGSTVLLRSASSEFGINFNPSAAVNGGTYFTDSDNNSGRFDTIASGTTAQSLTVRLTKVSATEVRMSGSFNGNPLAESNFQTIGGMDPGTSIGSLLTFDELSLGWVSGNSGEIYYDNIQVLTSVPEPSGFAILALGLGFVVLFRRKRR